MPVARDRTRKLSEPQNLPRAPTPRNTRAPASRACDTRPHLPRHPPPPYNPLTMRYLAATLAVLATALWLGGLVALFLFAPAIFQAFGPEERTIAGKATSTMFVVFAKYQLVLAGVALIAAFLGYLQRRTGLLIALFVCFAIATVGAVANNVLVIPPMESLRLGGESGTPQFKKLHGISMGVSLGITLAVAAAALILPAACRAVLHPRRDDDSLAPNAA